MARIARFTWVLLTAVALTQAKPLNSTLDVSINEIGRASSKPLGFKGQPRGSALPTNEVSKMTIGNTRTDSTADSAAGTTHDTTALPPEEVVTTRPWSWFLTPLAQKIQFSPQSFLQDRLISLKEVLNTLGVSAQNATAKQLIPGGLVHLVGPNDSGFYTNRLEPAGFFGGNGLFANKGGILGGPGAILSTGSLFTDYPTPYRKK